MIGTYFIIFSGCGVVVVNVLYGGTITFPGICVTWGLIVMVMIYSTGHISGAHFNPAVTVTFAIFRRFPWHQVIIYSFSLDRIRSRLFQTLQVQRQEEDSFFKKYKMNNFLILCNIKAVIFIAIPKNKYHVD